MAHYTKVGLGTGYGKNKECVTCGRLCWNKQCRECYVNRGKCSPNKVSRWRSYHKKKKEKEI